MNYDEEEIGTAIRLEIDEASGRVLLVFDITNEKYKQKIRKNWTEDIEYKMINNKLYLNNTKG